MDTGFKSRSFKFAYWIMLIFIVGDTIDTFYRTVSGYFGDGTSSTELSPTHSYPFGSSIIAALSREASTGGCAGSKSVSFNINDFNDFVNLNPPNVFSPNEDGLNDFFTLDLEGDFKECFELEIYNRWGNLIYQNSNGNRWDGKTNSGKDVPQGTYFYILKIGETTITKSLTLLR